VNAALAVPAGCTPIAIRVDGPRQLFDSMDPAPFRERDLDPRADEFIAETARELPASARPALIVHVARSGTDSLDAGEVAISVQQYYARRAATVRRALRDLFRTGRISLAIGLAFVAFALAFGDWLATTFMSERYAKLVEESLIIGAWVALWRPMEIFLYDWWPIRAEARRYERLAAMPVLLRSEP
jgi:hypothetical protein